MEAVASLKHCPTSPRKMRLVVDLIRGLDADKALNILKFSQKEASTNVEKLLVSAINNWKAKNEGERVEDSQLYVKTAFVDVGRTLRRFQPAPMGRAYRIRKRANHITLIVDSRLAIANKAAQAAIEEAQAEEVVVEEPKAKKTTAKKEAVKKTTKTTSKKAK